MLMSLFVLENHSGQALDFAIVTAMFQAGVIIGAIISSVKKDWKNKEIIILQTIVIGILGYLIITIAPYGNFIMIGIGALIHAAMMPIANTMFLTIIQTKVPVETQGRVFSITVSLAFSIMLREISRWVTLNPRNARGIEKRPVPAPASITV